MVKLQVFIKDDCWSCAESKRIVSEIEPEFPEIRIEFLYLNDSQRPANVFATPTYLLNGRVISMGNPSREELRQMLLNIRTRV